MGWRRDKETGFLSFKRAMFWNVKSVTFSGITI